MKTVSAYAPASIGNFIVGFDILGMAVEQLGDRVEITALPKNEGQESKITIQSVSGKVTDLPMDPKMNTASGAMLSFLKDHPLPYDFQLNLQKGIPLSSGLGGSAASAVAAVTAINQFLDDPLDKGRLLKYCIHGESIASGVGHADNVAPSLLGGLQLLTSDSIDTPIELPFSEDLKIVLVHPSMKLDTKMSRSVLQDSLPLAIHSKQMAAVAGFVSSCYSQDVELMRRSLFDVLIEPQRSSMIPGFAQIKEEALKCGALGCSISGAGPTIFAVCPSSGEAEATRQRLCEIFSQKNLQPQSWISIVDRVGAKVISNGI